MNVLITGGAGFIGSHLSELFLSKGWKTYCIDNLSTGSMENIFHLINNPNFEFIKETILNESVVESLIEKCDVIVHLAAAVGVEKIIRDPINTIETNIYGTNTVLKIAERHSKKILLASTSEIYGKNESYPFREDSNLLYGPTTHPRWAYACSKAIDEFLALAYFHQNHLPIVIMRFFNTIGPRQSGNYGMVVPRFVNQALSGQSITVYGDGTQSRCFTDVRDVCEGIWLLCQHPQAVGEVFNIANCQEISILELAKRVIAITNSASNISIVPYEEAYGPGFEDTFRRVPDISKIFKLVGFQPKYPLDTTLKEIINSTSG